MSLEPLQHDAQLHYAPKDHSWVTVDPTKPFYAQATLPVNQFAIPPFDNIAISNDTAGNPLSAVYSKNSSAVATLVFDYDGSEFLTNTRIVYPA
jgi:hypothetical protein